jgi:uncharacterized membrane protein
MSSHSPDGASPRLSRGRLSWALLWVLIALYVTVFGALTILKHQAFQTTAFDLGTMDQAIWNTSQGRVLQVTIQPGVNIRLAGHVEPVLVLISLLYLLYSDPRVLLALQTVVVGLGALPIYLLARERLNSEVAALVFAASFLLFPALEAANIFDFHGVTLAATFLAFAFYFAKRRHGKGWFVAFIILAMSCREDMPLLAAMMGLYLLLRWRGLDEEGSLRIPVSPDRENWRLGLATILLAGVWFFVAFFVIPSHFSASGQHSQLDRYGYLGGSSLEIVRTMVLRPDIVLQHLLTRENASYLVGLLSPTGFMAVFAPHVLLLGLPTLLMNLLSTYAPMRTLGPFHYAAPLAPFFVISAVYGTAFLAKMVAPRLRVSRGRLVQSLAVMVLLSALIVHYLGGYSPLAAGFELPVVTDHERLAERFLGLIPAGAAVSAQSRLVPHLSHRERVYMFPRIEDAEYVLFDVTADSWPIHPNDEWRLFRSLVEERAFGILAAEDGYVLLQKGLVGADQLPDSFYEFARRVDPKIEYPATVEFGDELRLLGFDLRRDGDMTSVSLYWQALRPLARDYRIYPFFYDQEGKIIEDTTLRPMTTAIWYPTSKWQPGETVWMRTLPWDVGADFSIGLGVTNGDEWLTRDERLAAEVITSTLRVRLLEDDTWVQLAEVQAGLITTPRRDFSSPHPSHPLYANLDDQVSLLGYDLRPETPRAGDAIHLVLYWRATSDVDTNYTVFTHLIDAGGGIVTQHDGEPVDGGYPTSEWLEGEIVRDEHVLKLEPSIEPGQYTLLAGLYNLETGERLAAYDENGVLMPQARIVLGGLRVEQ